jgi:hypothetical protein
MVKHFRAVISENQQRIISMLFAPNSSLGRAVLGDDNTGNKLFLTYFFHTQGFWYPVFERIRIDSHTNDV